MGSRGGVRRVWLAATMTLAVLTWACASSREAPPPPPPPPPPGAELQLETVVTGLASPVDMQDARDGSGRLFFVERAGRIRIFRNGALLQTPFLDIVAKVNTQGEGGLLGLAFHPQFAMNGRFFVHYTRTGSPLETVISEFQVAAGNADAADPASEFEILTMAQPFSNHNGGQIAFGPDGFLYIGLGDGGDANDPMDNGQDLGTLLGKLLRIDINATAPPRNYAIPPDNPFLGDPLALPEIWAYGLRNPWRFSFDSMTGRLFLGDVGQGAREEVDIVAAGDNLGWKIMEGSICRPPTSGCDMTGLVLPIHDYPRSDGATVVGGAVYRGPTVTLLAGKYVFGDFISGRIWSLEENAQGNWQRQLLFDTGASVVAFGTDQAGELYVVLFSGAVQRFRQVVTSSAPAAAP